MKRVIVTGGIGSGKSMVCRMLQVMGYPVYDCDSQAIRLINDDTQLKCDITTLLGSRAYDSQGRYDRAWVAARVFADPQLLQQINALVHPAVLCDIDRWAARQCGLASFVETALMRQSGLNIGADAIWRVTAPTDVRIARVRRRSGLSERQIAERIAAQHSKEAPFDGEVTLVNDDHQPLLPQLIQALDKLK